MKIASGPGTASDECRSCATTPTIPYHPAPEDVLRVLAGTAAAAREHRPHHQPCTNQKNERERHLGDDHAAAKSASAIEVAAAPADRSQHFHDVGARRAQRRDEPAEKRRRQT